MKRDGLRVTIHTDGGARGNPGPAAAGYVVMAEDGTVLLEKGLYLGRATNNVAEYRALLAGLSAAAELGAAEVRLFSDSELLVRQMNGQYRVRDAKLKPLWSEAAALAGGFARYTFGHFRREHNRHADRLVNRALDLKRDVEDADAP